MKKIFSLALIYLTFITLCTHSNAEDYFNKKSQIWLAPDFKFHTGEIFKELKLGYTTLGNPSNPAVLILHGTTSTGEKMLSKDFGGELFGAGQPLDATKYFIVLPDALGAGRSSKPSDGLKTKFPKYNYDDMVQAHYRLLTEGLKINHLRLILGNSMGGMQTWLWGVEYPEFMDILVPMASLPIPMSGRNWMLRRFLIDSIKNDPEWMQGNYVKQPSNLQFVYTYFEIATSGGSKAFQKIAPNTDLANQYIDKKMHSTFNVDANDFLYIWESSKDYDPSGKLDRIKAKLLVINSEDDERNPVELGAINPVLAKIPHSHYYLIPSSEATSGHGTTGNARWWKEQVREILD
jgi:homoserine O-acetyltransferase